MQKSEVNVGLFCELCFAGCCLFSTSNIFMKGKFALIYLNVFVNKKEWIYQLDGTNLPRISFYCYVLLLWFQIHHINGLNHLNDDPTVNLYGWASKVENCTFFHNWLIFFIQSHLFFLLHACSHCILCLMKASAHSFVQDWSTCMTSIRLMLIMMSNQVTSSSHTEKDSRLSQS